MFKFFKMAEKETLKVQTQNVEIINSKVIQADIHRSFESVLKEFDLVQSKESKIEDLRTKLETFKEENKSVYNKIEILNTLNLSATPSVRLSLEKLRDKEIKVWEKIMKIRAEIKNTEGIKNYVAEYHLKYPSYKFIDDTTMVNIMKKYDLVLGEAFTYGREIPDDNLAVISQFSVEIKESEETYILYSNDASSRCSHFSIVKQEKKVITNEYWKCTRVEDYSNFSSKQMLSSYITSKFKMIAPENHFKVPTFKNVDWERKNIDVPIMKLNPNTRKYEFNTSTLNDMEAKKREVLDPIACLEVAGGYIIMSAWDKEAEIPEIQNTFLN